MDELTERQRKERKELQAKIQAIKKAVPKGDRKRKKESSDDISRLEAELRRKHEEEKEIIPSSAKEDEDELANEMKEVSVNGPQEDGKREPKVSKAQRRREKKAASEKERDQRIAEEESQNVNSSRKIEYDKIKAILKQRCLALKEIPSDGHCLYRAVADQLSRQELETSVDSLRKRTAEYMRSHSDDFMAFLTNPDTQDLLTSEEYEKYCHDVETTASWGGQLEINAMSNFLQVPVEVIQADGPVVITGEHLPASSVILSYHRHAYGLGEHYNSVVTISQLDQSETADDEGFS